ncbi:MAG: hypothetical protein K0S27_289 [Gammaproteobacteria bacterium]|jgi:TonB family protein|nr:hypothetical protein [Gammaproteobacteria bacterium]
MLNKTAKVIERNSFWLSLFFHCLLFSGISFVWLSSSKLIKTKEEDKPSLSIPAYVYHNEAAPLMEPSSIPDHLSTAKTQQKILPPSSQKQIATSKLGIEKPLRRHISSSFNITHPIDISRSPETEPVHLIGDKKIDKPLLTLLGKALTRHLVYPKSALDLNVKGTSVIGFLLYPDGQITDVQLLQTSGAEVLDQSALAAAKAIGPVAQVSQYLDQPKWMVIGIIYS